LADGRIGRCPVGDTVEVLDHYQEAWTRHQELLEMGVAREFARLVLPVGISTEIYWSVNARAAMPATHAACVEFGRRGP